MNELMNLSIFGGVLVYRILKLEFCESKIVRAVKCGHMTRIFEDRVIFGKKVLIDLSTKDGDTIPYCHDCVEKMVIRCARCGKPIFPGDSVSIVHFEDKIPEYAVAHGGGFIGCLRLDCSCGGDFIGTWCVPGKVINRLICP